MGNTKIPWAEKVWNPITGCTKISPGCQNCYAKRMANRLQGRNGYPVDEPFRVTLHPERLEEPIHWWKRCKIFVCSMGDLFHEDVPFSYISAVFAIMAWCRPQNIFIILTKRPERMKEFFDWLYSNASSLTARPYRKVPYDDDKINLWVMKQASEYGVKIDVMRTWPLSNVWLGVTVVNQKEADLKIPLLLQIQAAVRLVSIEPMLGPMNIVWALTPDIAQRHNAMIARGMGPDCWPEHRVDWVICGGETGPNARPLHPDWVRDLRDQCQSANVPFFFKQWGEFVRCDYQGKDFGASYIDSQCIDGELWDLDNCDDNGNLYSTGDNPTCPKCKGMGFLRIGKKAAGDLLDGERYHEIPRVS